jgi:hypothetical protein
MHNTMKYKNTIPSETVPNANTKPVKRMTKSTSKHTHT